ncbi:MAG: hypothetical protein ACE5G5_03825 [Candidatus Methylomirabilales bacterium]
MYRYVILVLILTGCASSQSTFKRPNDLYYPNPVAYPYHYGDSFIDLFYRCTRPQAGGVLVEGYGVSSMNANVPVLNFEVKLTARSAHDRRLARKWTFGDDLDASPFDPVPFEVSVPVSSEAARYDLYYDFQYPDSRAYQDQFATVKDVCGSRWRRKASWLLHKSTVSRASPRRDKGRAQ